MRQHTRIDDRTTARPRASRRGTVVIADDGNAASIIVLDGHQQTATGSVFEHHGRSWMIRGSRRHSRVLVAEPLAIVEQ